MSKTTSPVSITSVESLDECIEQLKNCHPLKESQVRELCDRVRK